MVLFRFVCLGLFIFIFTACTGKEEHKNATAESATQEQATHSETSSEVPALHEFHEVIYQIWHKAWPEKNTQLLKELLPQIEDGFSKLQQAPLPGILQDKQAGWSKGIQDMAGIIAVYKSSAANGQNEELLKAAEDLHSQFEQLVRLIRPVSKEIDSYHQELYMLYHYYMPAYDLEKINSSVAELMLRIKAIENAPVPARLKSNQTAYQQAVTDLKSALQQLQKTLQDNSPKDQVDAAIKTMHTKYQQLISVCE
jgi:hypothetical protein